MHQLVCVVLQCTEREKLISFQFHNNHVRIVAWYMYEVDFFSIFSVKPVFFFAVIRVDVGSRRRAASYLTTTSLS